MPKKLLKRLMIAEDKLVHNKTLRAISSTIREHNVWHLNRRSATRAMFIGLFWAFVPMPLQMVPAALCCILWRANLPLSVALVWLTNPVTMPPVFYVTYRLGAFILDTPPIPFQLEWEWVMESIPQIWKPLYAGSLIAGFCLASAGYTIVDLLWRWTALQRWKKRREKHREKHSKTGNHS